VAANDIRQLTRQIESLVSAYDPLMRAQAQVAEAQEEVNDSVEEAKSRFTKLADALNEPKNIKIPIIGVQLKTFLKLGYAFVPMFFRIKNGVEILAGSIGKLMDSVGDPNKGGPLLSLLRGLKGDYKSAKNLISGVDSEGNKVSRKDAAKDFFGITAMGKLGKGFLKMFKRNEEQSDKIKKFGVLKSLKSVGAVALMLSKYLFLGTLLVPLLLMFFKSKAFKEGLSAVISTLKVAFEIASKGFSLIKDGVLRLIGVFRGEGGFFENMKEVFFAILEIAGGILSVLFSLLLATLGSVIAGVLGTIKGFLSEKLGTVIDKLESLAEKAKNNAVTIALWTLFIGSFLAILTAGLLVFAGTIAPATAFIAIGIAALVGAISGIALMIDDIKETISDIWPFASGGVTGSGLSLVGERGPELVNLPQGSRVFSNRNSRKMLSGGATNNITVNVQGRIGASDTELRQIATKVGQMINKEVNRTTSSRGTLG